MNLSSVSTPAELVEQNNTAVAPSTSQLDALVDKLDLAETYSLALRLIQTVGSFHQSVMEDLKEEAELDRLVLWSQDEQKLHNAYDLLLEVSEHD